jgi:hypothetical protein
MPEGVGAGPEQAPPGNEDAERRRTELLAAQEAAAKRIDAALDQMNTFLAAHEGAQPTPEGGAPVHVTPEVEQQYTVLRAELDAALAAHASASEALLALSPEEQMRAKLLGQ